MQHPPDHTDHSQPDAIKTHYDILIPGDYFCDLIFTGIPQFPALGTEIFCDRLDVVPGGTLNTVIALQKLSLQVGWVATVGNDFFSHYVLHTLRDYQIDTGLLQRLPGSYQRVTVSLSYPDDRAFVTRVDPDQDVIALTIDALARVTCRHLHFPSLMADPRLPDLIATCHQRSISVSMDCQYNNLSIENRLVCDVLRRVDVFMPNASEAQRLTGSADLERAIRILAEKTPCIVIKNGPHGALAVTRDGEISEPALALADIVDTTGAGDVFNAGFLRAWLDGRDLRTCLRWGNYCGGMSTQGPGGTGTAPTLAQATQAIG